MDLIGVKASSMNSYLTQKTALASCKLSIYSHWIQWELVLVYRHIPSETNISELGGGGCGRRRERFFFSISLCSHNALIFLSIQITSGPNPSCLYLLKRLKPEDTLAIASKRISVRYCQKLEFFQEKKVVVWFCVYSGVEEHMVGVNNTNPAPAKLHSCPAIIKIENNNAEVYKDSYALLITLNIGAIPVNPDCHNQLLRKKYILTLMLLCLWFFSPSSTKVSGASGYQSPLSPAFCTLDLLFLPAGLTWESSVLQERSWREKTLWYAYCLVIVWVLLISLLLNDHFATLSVFFLTVC